MSWYLGAVAEHAEAIFSGQLTRLVVTQPPGTLKSMTWCVLFPAWVWIDWPQTRFLIGTHDLSNACRDATYCRKLIRSSWYQNAFNPQWRLADDQDAKLFYQTTSGGHRLSVSTGGAVAGKKGHILIVDDLHDATTIHSPAVKTAEKNWFRVGFSDRMMNFKTGCIVVIGHRLERDDIEGELIDEGWPELRLPEEFSESLRKTFPVHCEWEGRTLATDPRTADGEWLRPERFGPDERDTRIRESGARNYAAKHQQSPIAHKGRMFNPDKVRRVPTYPVGTVAVRYFDTAASEKDDACHTSGVLIGQTPEGRYVVIDVKRDRWGPTDRNRVMRNTGLEDMRRPGLTFRRLYWEKGTSDAGLERDQLLARALAGIPCAAAPPKGPKKVRAEAFASQWEAGNVDVVDADWTTGYLNRMADFPDAKDKDDTDASSGGFNKLALVNDDPDLYGTAEERDTVVGNLPAGTFGTTTDPYA